MSASIKPIEKPKMPLASLQHLVASDLKAANAIIIENIKSDIILIEQLANHIIAAGGKRLRPSLTIVTAKLLGYNGTRHQHLAACVEFIHTATLLHDDVIDASDLRRGEATANALWGNEASVLVGDFLLSRAFQMMVNDGSLDVLKVLSDAAATIAKGEVKQLTLTHQIDISEADYFEVIQSKTSALFAAACELGAICAEQADAREAMHRFGMALGTAFQLVDDALDYQGDADILGKNIGDDWREGKATYPLMQAYKLANSEDQAFLKTLFEQESDLSERDLPRAQKIIASTKAIAATYARAEQEIKIAQEILEHFADSPAKTALQDTMRFCIERDC
jgi:octaprenyl-diphosphate synthase